MSAILTVRDESLDRCNAHEWFLDVLTERLSVRELIQSRIFQEVDDYNARHPHSFRGLIQPAARDRATRRHDCFLGAIDKQKQFESACEAFEAGRLVILIGDAQADDLDDEFDVQPGTAVTFLRLTLIVGG